MKKLLSVLLGLSMLLSMSTSVLAADIKPTTEPRIGYVEYATNETNNDISTYALSTSKEYIAGKVDARLFGGVGNVEGVSASFTVSDLPSTAVITNVQVL